MTSEKWLGVHTGGAHYLDHLGILCEGLEIPLIVTQPDTYEATQQFYPRLQVEYRDLSELTLDFLAQNANVIFESGHHFAIELMPLFELLYGKKMRVVYCPHGNSDKKETSHKDISLIYGDHMVRHLQKTGELSRLSQTVVIGNYRLAYYRLHANWYDEKLDRLLCHLDDRKTVIYAPTWSHPEGAQTKDWLQEALRVIDEVGQEMNVLLRWHPFLNDLYPGESEQLKQRCQDVKGAIDLSSFPCIYPILNRADFYLGDFSSIGYDFLSFNKPLFFLNRTEGDIYQCGITLSKEEHWGRTISQFQDSSDFNAKREALFKKVFGREVNFQAIKRNLKKILHTQGVRGKLEAH